MAKSAMRMRFDRAFKEARDAGEKTFEFEGKSYNTRMAGEGGASKRSAPLPPTRDIPREGDPEKPAPPMESTPTPMRRPSGNAGEAPRARRSPFERMPNPYEAEAQVQGTPAPPPKTGRLKPLGQNIVETNAGYPINPSDETGYRKGGMVKKKSSGAVKMKSGGMVKKKSGGAVRGAGAAQRGQGKMRMC